MYKKMLLFFAILSVSYLLARTVRRYEIKHPGHPVPIKKYRDPFIHQDQPYMQIIDQSVLEQEQFKMLKEQELEGREPYQESKKTTITRTFG